MTEVSFIYTGDVDPPRFRAKNQPIRLRWGDDGEVEAKIGDVLYQNVFQVALFHRSPRPVVVVWTERLNESGAVQRVCQTFRDVKKAFEFWMTQCEYVYCDNDDCVRLPDGRVFDMQ